MSSLWLSLPFLHSWRHLALFGAWVSVFWNIIEGLLAIGVAIVSSELILAVYGVQSFIEIFASILVVWRLKFETSEGDRSEEDVEKRLIDAERKGTLWMGGALMTLAIMASLTALYRLYVYDAPDDSVWGLVVALSACVAMFILWKLKARTAIELDSSTLSGDAACSKFCFQLSLIVVFSTLISYKQNYLASFCSPSHASFCSLWWLDSLLSILIGYFLFRDGLSAYRNASSEHFTGGVSCCANDGPAKSKSCGSKDKKCVVDGKEADESAPMMKKTDSCCSSKQKSSSTVDNCCKEEKPEAVKQSDSCCSKKDDQCSSKKNGYGSVESV